MQNTTGLSDYYVRPDVERVVLVLDDYYKKRFTGDVGGCDYTAGNTSVHCQKVYSVMKFYNYGNLIREFGNEMHVDTFPPLPSSIERHLRNSYEVVEWVPAK